MEVPEPLGKFRKYPALGDWLNKLRDYVASLRPLTSHGTFTEHTSQGVFRKAKPGAEEAAPSTGATWLP